jgi:PEP-CTERM motif
MAVEKSHIDNYPGGEPMRVKWILAGVVGTSAAMASAVAMASPLPFQAVLNNLYDGTTTTDSGDSIPGTGDVFGSADQVVVGDGGSVAVLGNLYNDSDDVVIYNTPSGAGRNNLAVVDATGSATTVVNDWGADKTSTTTLELDGLNNLAMSSNPSSGIRLSFTATSGGSGGVLQSDITGPTASPTSTLGDVAFDGDGQGYSPDSGELQVNGSGQALFPATLASADVIARGDVSGVATQFTSTSGLAVLDPGIRVALAADNSGAAVLTASSVNGVYSIASNGTVHMPALSVPQTPGLPDDPDPLIGYYSSGGNSGALFVANTAGSTQNIYLEKNNGTPQSILTTPITDSSSPSAPLGEVTPNGKIAVYVPDTTNGDTIKYDDTSSISPLGVTIASVATPSESTLTAPASAIALNPATAISSDPVDPTDSDLLIEGLQDPYSTQIPWAPEVNSNGTVIFDAVVGLTSDRDDNRIALLDWDPLTGGSPTILIAEGDQLTIDGQAATVDTFSQADPDSQIGVQPPNYLQSDNDYYKNSLSDDGYVAVTVNYYLTDDPSSTGTAVLLTQLTSSPVPEPATLGLLSLSGLTLLGRRRR